MLRTGLHAFSFVCVNSLNASGKCDLPVVMFKYLVLKQGSAHLIQVQEHYCGTYMLYFQGGGITDGGDKIVSFTEFEFSSLIVILII